ncbi:hypothetical protein MAPG_11029, partial [Magnaporthiopsis poae ATCC 64411]|uniref:Uncharacterized protein n=1 Tax=Magnaporthiopsis poae (strain ATCC 64411 / 73-15) TaxID=644358 RepID=A0A0C4EE64_MAGP6
MRAPTARHSGRVRVRLNGAIAMGQGISCLRSCWGQGQATGRRNDGQRPFIKKKSEQFLGGARIGDQVACVGRPAGSWQPYYVAPDPCSHNKKDGRAPAGRGLSGYFSLLLTLQVNNLSPGRCCLALPDGANNTLARAAPARP